MKDFGRVLVSNGIILLLGFLITFLLPLKLTIEDFGYWQLYFFYSGFVGLFMFGFLDGIHLKYAGVTYSSIDKSEFRLYFRCTCCLSLIMFIIMSFFIIVYIKDYDRMFVLFFINLNIIIFNINGFFTHINQVTSRFKYYSWGIILDRIIFVILIIPMLFMSLDSYKYYLIINVISRVAVVIYNISISRELVFGESMKLMGNYNQIIDLIKCGIPLTISAILSMLLISFPRLIVDNFFGIEEFGMFSFANSMLSIAVQLVIAVSTVLYPLLRKMEKDNYEIVNNLLNSSVWIFGSIMLCAYFPIVFFLKNYLPKYVPILEYLYFLFPMMIYQCKNNIVITTFYKVLRLEKVMLINNVGGLLVNLLVTICSYYMFESILSIIVASVVCFAAWNYYVDWYLKKKSKWNFKKKYYEPFIILAFLMSTQIENWVTGLFVYLVLLLCVVMVFKASFLEWYDIVISILRNKKEKY
ncbi:oligosaccharide flippase family protein [Bacillus cereus]|uniref:oligosaccharide flippase family protein n=1 Tax=Bacillus cereus TaxID=1396 RepID=UPI001CEF7721|nr:oligosaccharide flippase family protein [Bacillus cereus]